MALKILLVRDYKLCHWLTLL